MLVYMSGLMFNWTYEEQGVLEAFAREGFSGASGHGCPFGWPEMWMSLRPVDMASIHCDTLRHCLLLRVAVLGHRDWSVNMK